MNDTDEGSYCQSLTHYVTKLLFISKLMARIQLRHRIVCGLATVVSTEVRGGQGVNYDDLAQCKTKNVLFQVARNCENLIFKVN